MPILKARLNRSEEAEDQRCLREMYHEGVDISDDSLDRAPALDISVIGGLETLIFNLPSGLAGYAITVRFVARTSGLILMEPEITTQHDRQIVLECFSLGGPVCTLGQCKYLAAEVLNDRFPLKFHRRGHLIEGVILATGLEPIPKEYVHGMAVPLKVTFWDQFGSEINVESKLSVDRSTTPRPRLVRSQSSLRDSGKVPETREPLGTGDAGVPAWPGATPIVKTRGQGGN